MAQQSTPRRLIESCYPPEQLQTATQGRRLAGYIVDSIIVVLTFGVGWLVWLLLVAPRGQSPGKQLLGMYIMRADGTRAGGGYTWVRELIIKTLLFGAIFAILGAFTGGLGQLLWVIPAVWCVWDAERQCLWDKVASTYVAHSPTGFRPLTANEMRVQGEDPPARDGIPTGRVEPSPPPAPSGLMDYPRDPTSMREQSTADRLRELQRLHSEGLITDEQYEERRAEIMDEL
ncbi:MAG: RDD family protein [Chloroflexi bacterium]|nr:RDD family protein [Chloroflexota bacterium]